MAKKIEGIEWLSAWEATQALDCTLDDIRRRVAAGELRGMEQPWGLMVQLVGEDVATWDRDDEPEPTQPAPPPTRPSIKNPKSKIENPTAAPSGQPSEIGPTLSTREAAKYLGVSVKQISHIVRELGHINGWKENGCWRVMRDDVERYRTMQRHWEQAGGLWTPYGRKEKQHAPKDERRPVAGPALQHSNTPTLQPDADLAAAYWLTLAEAAERLQLSGVRVGQMAKTGALPGVFAREAPGPRLTPRARPQRRVVWWFKLSDVLDAMDRREAAIPAVTPNEDAMMLWGRARRGKPVAPPGDRLLTRREAARLLGVKSARIGELVRKGRLFAWQEQTGKQGCPTWFSERQILRYMADPDHQTRRAAWQRGHQSANPQSAIQNPQSQEWQFERKLLPDQQDGSRRRKDHGEYLTAAQAAELLGITPRAVKALRARGRLTGYRLHGKNEPWSRRWWFFKKADVHRLQEDPQYNRRHAAARRAMSPEVRQAREWAEETRQMLEIAEQTRWMERPSDAIRDKGAPVHPYAPANPDDWDPGLRW